MAIRLNTGDFSSNETVGIRTNPGNQCVSLRAEELGARCPWAPWSRSTVLVSSNTLAVRWMQDSGQGVGQGRGQKAVPVRRAARPSRYTLGSHVQPQLGVWGSGQGGPSRLQKAEAAEV